MSTVFANETFTPAEIRTEIKKFSNKNDKVDAKIANCLPQKGIILLTVIYNHFPAQWKCAKIGKIPKADITENEIASYRPISLLYLFSKVIKKIFLSRGLPILNENRVIPKHQYGFRRYHGTPEQCHRVVEYIADSSERKKNCSAAFLDIHQSFDKVGLHVLLFKFKNIFFSQVYLVLFNGYVILCKDK